MREVALFRGLLLAYLVAPVLYKLTPGQGA
jgi:hypothetical protein